MEKNEFQLPQMIKKLHTRLLVMYAAADEELVHGQYFFNEICLQRLSIKRQKLLFL